MKATPTLLICAVLSGCFAPLLQAHPSTPDSNQRGYELLDLGTRQIEMDVRQVLPTNDTERSVLLFLGSEPKHIDEIAIESGFQIGTLSAQLLQMQLKGLVRNVGTQHYVRG